MKSRVPGGFLLAVLTIGALGCRTARPQDPGTSTGLAYRPQGKPALVDPPSTYRVYPTPKPLSH